MNGIFDKIDKPGTIRTGLIAALVFAIPASIYLWRASYASSWMLYFGSFLFLISIGFTAYADSKKGTHAESLMRMILASELKTIAGVVFSALLCIILLFVFVPDLGQAQPNKVLSGEPVTMNSGKTHGLSFQLFFAATVINFFVGTFASLIFPFSLTRSKKMHKRKPLSSELPR